MEDDSMAHRRYKEKDVGALIQRATALHAEATGEKEHSLTLEEVEHIAAELGLPPAYMRQAAQELEASKETTGVLRWLGSPFVIETVRTATGTMTEAQWEEAVLAIRKIMDKRGRVSKVGQIREWTHTLGEGENGINFTQTQVTIRPDDDQTSIHIQKKYKAMALLYVLPVLLSVFFAGVLLTEQPDLLKFLLAGGGVLGTFALIRTAIASWTSRQKDRVKKLGNVLQQTLSTVSPEPSMINEPVQGQIDIPEMDEPEQVGVTNRQATRI